jgi:hypothetical protein
MKSNTSKQLTRVNSTSAICIAILLLLTCSATNATSAFGVPDINPPDVEPPDIGSANELDPSENLPDAAAIPTIKTSRVTVEGAIFPVPDSLESEIEKYRKIAPVKQYASVLVTKNTIFVVFSDEMLETGFATIDGWKLVNLRWDELELGVVKAESVSVERKGTPSTIDEIKSNPDDYVLKLVKIDATIRHISFLVDPDDGSGFVMPITAGRIVDNPINPANFVNLPEKVSEFSKNHNRESLNQILGITGEGLSVFDFETKYWTDAEAEVNAIVLYPEIVDKFIAKATEKDVSNLIIQKGDKILLYNIGTDIKSIKTSIGDVKSNPENYVGKVVTFTASDIGAAMSTQEAIKEASGGKYPPVDVVLHGMVAWCRPPPAPDKIQLGTLATVGVSSHHQGVAISPVNGVLEIQSYTGKIVSGADTGMDLPDAVALVTYEREKVGDISVEEISSDVKDIIEGEVLTIKESLQKIELPTAAAVVSQTENQHETSGAGVVETPTEPMGSALMEVPGFEAVFGVVGLLMITLLMKRRM